MKYLLVLISGGFFLAGFGIGSHYDTSNWNPLEDPNFVNCTAEEEADLSSVGWGVQQDSEAAAVHEGFVTGMTTRSGDRFNYLRSKENIPEAWHKAEHQYYLAGLGGGALMNSMGRASLFVASGACG